MALVRTALEQKHVELCGFHCHIGSQIFEAQPFIDAADIMLRFIGEVKKTLGFEAKTLNLGGGMAVRYLEAHPAIDYAENIAMIASHMRKVCTELNINMPNILMEPGRSLVADAGLTLYSVGTLKTIPGFRTYVSVDGGMPDNPRYALYEAPYSFCLANRMHDACDTICTVAGRCCESGDLLGEGIALPTPKRGDLLAVMTTGAYNYAMASNYNRIPRPAMVMLVGGKERLILRRESYEDLLRNEI
jgi:diaminopimelate decarboxylase